MDEEEEQRRSVRDFIVATDIYIYIYRFAFSTRTKKTRGVFFQRERRRTSITTTNFLCFVSQRNDAPFSSIDFTIGNNLTAYTNELDL